MATHFYYVNTDTNDQVMAQPLALAFVGGLSGTWVLIFVTFLLSIKRKYLGTFFSLQTGCQYARSRFRREGDARQVKVVEYHRMKWENIRCVCCERSGGGASELTNDLTLQGGRAAVPGGELD